jgi:hypothetical protein
MGLDCVVRAGGSSPPTPLLAEERGKRVVAESRRRVVPGVLAVQSALVLAPRHHPDPRLYVPPLPAGRGGWGEDPPANDNHPAPFGITLSHRDPSRSPSLHHRELVASP